VLELYLKAVLYNRITVDDYRTVLLKHGLNDQDQKLKSTLLKQVESGSIQLAPP